MQDSSRPATGYPYPYPNPGQPAAAGANGYPPPQPAAGTAYPYQNPYYAPPQPNPRAVFYRRIFIVFLACLLIMGVILFVIFLIIRSNYPHVNLTSLSVTNFNVTSNNQVSGNWYIEFQVRNPNHKMSLYYYDIHCSVYCNRELLTGARLPPFDLGTRDQTPINATLSVTETYVEGRLADSIRKDRAASGSVKFDVKLTSVVSFRYGAFRKRRYVTVFCDDVAVGLPPNSSSGKMIGPEKECSVF